LAFAQPVVPVFNGAVQASAFRGASIPNRFAARNSSSSSTSMMVFGMTCANVFAMAGKRQKGRGVNRSKVKCHGVPTEADVAQAKQKADLKSWAAKTLQDKGDHRAADMAAKAEAQIHIYESMKIRLLIKLLIFEGEGFAAPESAAPAVGPVAPTGFVVTKEEVEATKESADLLKWAAKTLKAKGLPQYPEMQAKADSKVQEYESLKFVFKIGGSPTPVAAAATTAAAAAAAAPVAAAEPAPSAPAPSAPLSDYKPSAEELERMNKRVDLMVSAAQSLKEEGAPQYAEIQYAEMQARTDKKVQTYESIKSLLLTA